MIQRIASISVPDSLSASLSASLSLWGKKSSAHSLSLLPRGSLLTLAVLWFAVPLLRSGPQPHISPPKALGTHTHTSKHTDARTHTHTHAHTYTRAHTHMTVFNQSLTQQLGNRKQPIMS